MNVMPKARRLVGVALGAGAARGWAHIGALERLTEHGIEPCAVAGTSIGALVGGSYAAGKLDALKRFALSLTRRRMYTLLDISWRGSGLFAGDKLGTLLETELEGCTFGDLKIPFICIATELSTGHEMWPPMRSLESSSRSGSAAIG
jgi:NTE family protein